MNKGLNDWNEILREEFQKDYFKELANKIRTEYNEKTIYPKAPDMLKALRLTSFKNTRVVILGQDPYISEGQAEGLSFSVQKGVAIPKSLINIYKELKDDIGIEAPSHGSLVSWAEQGVLLLNSILTVEAHKSGSHQNLGWEQFTDEIIRKLNEKDEPVVFILWGNFARSKAALVTNPKHLVIESAHPSPLSAPRGFFGSKPFSRTNQFLVENGLEPINWRIEN